eukprot:scaffold14014_cov38-Phaeocystis_antarctica.AAC.1
MAGAARGGEAGAPAGEAQQARASVAWPSRRALNLHTERPCTPPYPQRATARRARYPCQHTHTHTHTQAGRGRVPAGTLILWASLAVPVSAHPPTGRAV